MKTFSLLLTACLAVALQQQSAHGNVLFKETFDEADSQERWTEGSEWKPKSEMGKWKYVRADHFPKGDKALKTTEDARFYSITAPLDAEVHNEGKDLVISYTVKFDKKVDCGGAYIKLVPPGFDPKTFGGDTDYSIMFGPDICGTSTKKTHAIFTYRGENLLTKKNIRCETDTKAHRYTFIVKADNTYEVKIDGKEKESGSLYDDWDFLPQKQIPDPEATKPADWDDRKKIPDPEDEKPEGWDDIPAQIPDPDATKPDDWDDEEDGEWEPPMIDNPDYKGEWEPKMIDNPNYKGKWEAPMIDNPDYFEDDKVHAVCKPCSHVGFELWQVTAGSAFDDIIVADSESDIEEFEKEALAKNKKINDEIEKEEEEERKKREEERRQQEEEEDDDEDDEYDDLDEEDEDEDLHDEL